MELAEVQAAHPEIESLLFSKEDPDAVVELLHTLRERFGKASISEEDRIRSQSIRNAAVLLDAVGGAPASFEEVLRHSDAEIEFRLSRGNKGGRAFELVNKTNQFNLNGKRYSDSEWQSYFEQEGAFLLTVSHQDKFGPLGEIAVLTGRLLADRVLRVDTWVMSCRAFSRRIEHQSLNFLFQKFNADRIVFAWIETPRNGPMGEFLGGLEALQPGFVVTRNRFDAVCPALFHTVKDVERG
jgi:FkbH-like protein